MSGIEQVTEAANELPDDVAHAIRDVYKNVTVHGHHLSGELHLLVRSLNADERLTSRIRDILFQAIRYADVDAAVRGDLDGVVDVQRAWPSLRSSGLLAPTVEMLLRAPVFLRVNTLKTNVEECAEALKAHNAEPLTETVIQVHSPYGLFRTVEFHKGWFEQQDINSQRVSLALDVRPGMRVIDACSGAGGKTLHLAALMKNKGRIIALDIGEDKIRQLQKRAARTGADIIEPRLITSTKTVKRLAASADRVLIDAPCTGTGVLRRNPDIPWHLSTSMISELMTAQADILRRNALAVKPGGLVVYAVCSGLEQEGPAQVRGFLDRHESFSLVSSTTYTTGQDGGDGFYVAVMTRTAEGAEVVRKSDDA
ncbi:MAG: RsmB/NOP family class I SAM-dependent RNA methyltransferase [bacterium]|nr:RsmB/NOP family class I SAM-dependent RNA methyltransferase [bacterium]